MIKSLLNSWGLCALFQAIYDYYSVDGDNSFSHFNFINFFVNFFCRFFPGPQEYLTSISHLFSALMQDQVIHPNCCSLYFRSGTTTFNDELTFSLQGYVEYSFITITSKFTMTWTSLTWQAYLWVNYICLIMVTFVVEYRRIDAVTIVIAYLLDDDTVNSKNY